MALDWRDCNRASWDERVPIHVASGFYDVPAFKRGQSTLRPFEIADVGSVDGRELVHLQCHFGLDTLSWARRGARVTGLDFSAPAIAAARRLADEIGVAASFVTADVYDAPAVLGRQFDVVYTGLGALCWLPDMPGWAAVVAQLLRPGGTFYLTEFHPALWPFAEDGPTLKYDYFTPPDGFRYTLTGSYADPTAPTVRNDTVQWNHGLGEVLTALIQAGLAIELVREHADSAMQWWPCMVHVGDDMWRTPPGMPSLPFMYSVRAVRR